MTARTLAILAIAAALLGGCSAAGERKSDAPAAEAVQPSDGLTEETRTGPEPLAGVGELDSHRVAETAAAPRVTLPDRFELSSGPVPALEASARVACLVVAGGRVDRRRSALIARLLGRGGRPTAALEAPGDGAALRALGGASLAQGAPLLALFEDGEARRYALIEAESGLILATAPRPELEEGELRRLIEDLDRLWRER